MPETAPAPRPDFSPGSFMCPYGVGAAGRHMSQPSFLFLSGSQWPPGLPDCMYVINEQRFLQVKALIFPDTESAPAAPFLSCCLRLPVRLSLFLVTIFSPQRASKPLCRRRHNSLSRAANELIAAKKVSHLCQRMAHFRSDASLCLLLWSVFNTVFIVVLKPLLE